MKIFLIGPDFFNYTSSLAKAVQQLGHQTATQTYRNFWDDCSYMVKKMERWGITEKRHRYYQKWNEQVLAIAAQYQPDAIIVLNGDYLVSSTMDKLKSSHCQLILWLVDSILRFPHIEKLIQYYDQVFSFDPRDEVYLFDKYKIHCSYRPGGYDPDIYFPQQGINQDIDVCFVGTATGNRIHVLRQVAEYMQSENKKLVLSGVFWDKRYFWKKRRFAQKYDPLQLFIQNRNIMPEEVAQLYRRSKICLNIHISEHVGVNTRTFEIMGTSSMELVDNKPKLAELVDIGTDVAVYQDIDDLINKIDYYLKDSNARKIIAESGQKKAAANFTVQHLAKAIMNKL